MIELKNEMLMVAQFTTDLGQHVPILPLAIETIQTCANISCDRSVSILAIRQIKS